MTTEELTDLIEACGQEWILDRDRESKLTFLTKKLNDCYAVFADKFTDAWIKFDDQSLRSEPDSYRVRAVIQGALPSRSPEFIACIWRVVHGDRIVSIEMQYKAIDSFKLRVEIESQTDHKSRKIVSDDIEDAAFLRYLWIGRINDKPFFAGYFPPRGRQLSAK